MPASTANFATQRTPFPHISASLPSGLNILMRNSAFLERSTSKSPSAPTDCWRLQSVRAAAAPFFTIPRRLSTTMKSFPAPAIFLKLSTISPLNNFSHNFLVADEIVARLSPARHKKSAAFHHDLGHARPRIVVARHDETVSAAGHDGQKIAGLRAL